MPGTDGKVQGDVVDRQGGHGRGTGAVQGQAQGRRRADPAARQADADLEDIDKPIGRRRRRVRLRPRRRSGPREEMMAFFREQSELLEKEGVAAVLTDSGKPFGLLDMTGGFNGKDRPSAANRTAAPLRRPPPLRDALPPRQPPGPGPTRVELEMQNTFVPGPSPSTTPSAKSPARDKPDEVVVVGAHLDSWDLGQGATDNGTGSVVVAGDRPRPGQERRRAAAHHPLRPVHRRGAGTARLEGVRREAQGRAAERLGLPRPRHRHRQDHRHRRQAPPRLAADPGEGAGRR